MAFALAVALHALAVVVDVYAIYYNQTKVKIPSKDTIDFGGKLKFLTVWHLILQAVYFTICLFNDAAGDHSPNPQNPPRIRRIKDYMFSAFAFPIAMFVGVTFWSIMAIDRELVLPQKLDKYFPMWLNHIMHTNIVIFILLEMFLSCRKYPTKKRGLTGLTIFMAIYLSWTFVIYYNTNLWVYPVMDVMDWPTRICFLLAMLAFCLILYLVGDYVNTKRWGQDLTYTKLSPKNSVKNSNGNSAKKIN